MPVKAEESRFTADPTPAAVPAEVPRSEYKKYTHTYTYNWG